MEGGEPRFKMGPVTYNSRLEYKCPSCPCLFSSTDARQQHVRKKHPRPFQCELCPQQFKHNYTMLRHIDKQHSAKFKCDYCSKLFSEEAIEKHKPICYHKPTHTCSHCKYASMSRDSLIQHQIRSKHEDRPYQCTHCSMQFIKQDEVVAHLGVHIANGDHLQTQSEDNTKPENLPTNLFIPDFNEEVIVAEMLESDNEMDEQANVKLETFNEGVPLPVQLLHSRPILNAVDAKPKDVQESVPVRNQTINEEVPVPIQLHQSIRNESFNEDFDAPLDGIRCENEVMYDQTFNEVPAPILYQLLQNVAPVNIDVKSVSLENSFEITAKKNDDVEPVFNNHTCNVVNVPIQLLQSIKTEPIVNTVTPVKDQTYNEQVPVPIALLKIINTQPIADAVTRVNIKVESVPLENSNVITPDMKDVLEPVINHTYNEEVPVPIQLIPNVKTEPIANIKVESVPMENPYEDLTCGHCDLKYRSMKLLQLHMTNQHPAKFSQSILKSNIVNKINKSLSFT